MADRIDAVLDHVAIAVPDWRTAENRWRGELGAGRASIGRNPTFASRQLRFANGGRLELLSPPEGDTAGTSFVARFLQRFGTAVHHLTLKVPELHQALDTLAAASLEAVDVNDANEFWQEGFLRPSQIGGLVVQIASTPLSDTDWAAFTGFTPEAPGPEAPELYGPLLQHTDLDRAHAVWTALGADVAPEGERLRCRWPDSVLDVVIQRGDSNGPVGLRLRGAGEHGVLDGVGPAVLAQR